MEKEKKKQYINNTGEINFISTAGVAFIFIVYFLPQYLGFTIAGFDMTVQRFWILVLLIYILGNAKRAKEFIQMIIHDKYLIGILPFLFVTIFTMILKTDINSFMQYFLEFLVLYLLIYIINEGVGLEKTFSILLILTWIMCIMGIIEYIFSKSLFTYLATLPGRYGTQTRAGEYRIIGPCNAALAYGLLLEIALPFACIDYKKDECNIFLHPILYFLLLGNVFLTGSRSTLLLFLVESFIIWLWGNREKRKINFLIILCIVVVLVLFLVGFYNTSIAQSILRSFASVLDSILGTEYAVNFGADLYGLQSSAEYRDLLKEIFKLNYLNPIIGRGVSGHFSCVINGIALYSIDSFYIATYIRFAYPGMITYLFFIIIICWRFILSLKEKLSGITVALFSGVMIYYVNLYWMDTLQTLRYVYILLALFAVYEHKKVVVFSDNELTKSRYILGGK